MIFLRVLFALLLPLPLATPATAGPARSLKPNTVIKNVKSLDRYRWIDAKDEATGLRLSAFDLRYGRGGIRIDGNASDIIIRDGQMRPKGINRGSDLPVAIDLRGTVHNVLIARVTAFDHIMEKVDKKYTNGDGFSSERGVYDVTYRQTIARGNSDGGYDLKSMRTVLDRTIAESNGRNYRLWGSGTGAGVVSRNTRGADIWLTGGADWAINGVTFERTNGNMGRVIFSEGSRSKLILKNCRFVGFPPGVPLASGSIELITDASCKPDAKGFVVSRRIVGPVVSPTVPSVQVVNAGQLLPDGDGDGLVTLGTRWAKRLDLRTNTVVKHLDVYRYRVVK